MNETTHRFLQAIVERVPEGRIAELRLFPAIRQGGIESAVAVVAVEQPELPLAAPDAEVGSVEAGADGFAARDDDAIEVADVVGNTQEAEVDAEEGVAADAVAAELADLATSAPVADALDVEVTRVVALPFAAHTEGRFALGDEGEASPSHDERETGVELAVEPASPALADSPYADAVDAPPASPDAAGASSDDGSPYRATPSDVEVVLASAATDGAPDEPAESIALGDILALPPRDVPVEGAPPVEEAAHKRYAILTARYRLVLKGPDRGKWEVDVVHEADAPLATVERVARGVARRSGDESDPEHFSGDALRHAIERPSWATSA